VRGAKVFAPFFDVVDASDAMRAFVLGELSSPARHWHGLVHHALMLRAIAKADVTGTERRRLIQAALFHDIVYDPRRSDNEEASAAVAERWLPPGDRAAVVALILATKYHRLDTDRVTRALLEADLGVLWTPSERLYAFYADGIRAEYAHVPDAAYRAGRSAVMTRLRDAVTPMLDDGRAARMRANIDRELRGLAAEPAEGE
jgi:predicted metal-dependent HD superfamily phosphohydrolase